MIELATRHLADVTDNDAVQTPNYYYNYERGTNVYSGNPVSIVEPVGLAYPSDYGYVAVGDDGTHETCLNKDVRQMYENCSTNNWMDFGYGYPMWTITPVNSDKTYVQGWTTNLSNYHDAGYQYLTLSSIYLKPSVKITYGNGTKENPYILTME